MTCAPSCNWRQALMVCLSKRSYTNARHLYTNTSENIFRAVFVDKMLGVSSKHKTIPTHYDFLKSDFQLVFPAKLIPSTHTLYIL